MRQGRYADVTPIASANLSNQLQAQSREEVRIFSDKAIAVFPDLTISEAQLVDFAEATTT
jgi:hypothetical protein